MVSDQTRNDIWQELLDSDRLVRYYEALANHYQRKHSLTLLLLGMGAASSFAAILDLFPDVVQLIASALVGIVAVWMFIADYAKKAAVAHDIGFQCRRLDVGWKELWAAVERIDEAEARRRLGDLSNQMNIATRRSSDAGIVDNRRLNKKSKALAFKTVQERYAT